MTDQELVKKAFDMHQFSYVPYSHFTAPPSAPSAPPL